MSNLTKYTRECIARAATAFAYDPKFKELNEEEDALAREAHAAIFPKAELATLKGVPANWIKLDACLRFNVGGQRLYLRTLDDGLPVPYRIGDHAGYSCHELGTIPHGDLCDRIQAHAQAVEATKTANRETYRKVLALVDSARTVKKLRTIWPEGEQFYAKYDAVQPTKLPAIRIDELNAELGIAA